MNCFHCDTNLATLCSACADKLANAAVDLALAQHHGAHHDDQDIKLDPNRLELTPPPKQRSLDLPDPSPLIV